MAELVQTCEKVWMLYIEGTAQDEMGFGERINRLSKRWEGETPPAICTVNGLKAIVCKLLDCAGTF